MADGLARERVRAGLPGLAGLRALYREAFPRGERLPFWLLRLGSLRAGDEFSAYCENGAPCGLVYLCRQGGMTFVLYLAVAASARGRGVGARILEDVAARTEPDALVLNIETVDPRCADYETRARRRRFYERAGFADTGCRLRDAGAVFDVLCRGGGFSQTRYAALLRRMSCGLSAARFVAQSKE